ncbi:MAG: metal ABC transporter ATP-binding protein [Candidatus Omnitrophota bacterium]
MERSCGHCCLKIEGLNVAIDGHPILENVNLHTDCKELLSIIGPNGAGKTTLLRVLLGDIPYQGRINFQEKGLKKKNPRIGYVPQKLNFDYNAPVSVQDLIAASLTYAPVWCGIAGGIRKRIEAVLERFSVAHLLDRTIGSLSGGELQRVLLAMAMIPIPDLLLLDEPVSAIDVKGLSLFYETVMRLKKEHDISIVMVTHDLAGIAPYADRMILLNRSVLAEGTPRQILSDKKLVETFQLELLNVSRISLSTEGKSDE